MWTKDFNEAWPNGGYKDLHPQEAMGLQWSEQSAESYLRERVGLAWHLTEDHLRTLAVARLERLLQAGRRQIDGLFSEEEVIALLNMAPGKVYAPHELGSLVGALVDSFDVEPDEVKGTPLGDLVDKLARLDELGCVALADALERAWYGLQRAGSVEKSFELVGVSLR